MHFPPEVQNIIDLISRGELEKVKKAIHALRERAGLLPGQNMVYALCSGPAGFGFLALQQLERELQNFPDNEFARRYQAQLLDRQKMNRGSSQASRCKMTFIVLALSGVSKFENALKAIAYQAHRNYEVLVLKRESDPEIPWGKFELTDARYISVSDSTSISQALMRCFTQATGDIITIVNEPTTIWSDTGLLATLELFAANSQVHFAKGEDFYVKKAASIELFPSSRQRWSRQLLLKEENFFPPALILSGEGVLFRRSCLEAANISLESDFHEAYLFDLWVQLSRSVALHTLAIPIAGCEASLFQKGRGVSTLYVSECLQVIQRDRALDLRGAELSTPPSLVYFKGLNETPHSARKALPSYRLESARLAFLTRSPIKISLAMPSFNQKNFIEQSIDSVLSQNWPNLEFLILDGGSTDGSLKIIEKYKKHLNFLRSHPDGGQYFAVQEGLQRCTGEIMTWLNSDDILAPSALANVADQFESRPDVQWLTGRQSHIDTDGNFVVEDNIVAYDRAHYLDGGFDDPFIQQEGTFWRRALWEQAGGTLDLRWKLAAELELWVRFFRYASLLSVKCALARFRFQPDQRSALQFNAYLREANYICALERSRIKNGEFTRMLEPLEIGEWPASNPNGAPLHTARHVAASFFGDKSGGRL